MHQSSEKRHSEFELRVDFTGLCLFVKHPRNPKRMAVLMPDARLDFAEATMWHDDDHKAPAVPHVGYVRFDLANLDVGDGGELVPAVDGPSPSYEVVHRFDRESLHFGLHNDAAAGAIGDRLALPTFDEFAPSLTLKPDLFTTPPRAELLSRMTLHGGAIESIMEHRDWSITSEVLDAKGRRIDITRQYGGLVRWTRTVHGRGLTLRIVSFDGHRRTEIPLRPTTLPGDVPAIALKVANLCATNPLEWDELEQRVSTGPDNDFKWLYRLLQPRPDARYRLPPLKTIPVPNPVVGPTRNEGLEQDCFSGVITDEFELRDD